MILVENMTRDLNVDQIRKLWILDLILQCGSLKKAALQAKVSPSAISQCLTSLENSMGKRLLVRERGTIVPTPAALAVLDIVRPAFAIFDRLRTLNHAPTPKMSWLNFGTYESIAIDILPRLIHSLREKMPGLKLNLRIGRTPSLLTMVRKGELCAALVTETDNLERFHVREVSEDRLGLFVSNRHPIQEVGWKAIADYGIGSLAPAKDGLPRYFTKYLRQVDPIRPFILSDSFEALRAAAVGGTLVAVLPHRVAKRANELCELSPPKLKAFKETGRHRICIVSQANCDPEEVEFLAAEASRLLPPVVTG